MKHEIKKIKLTLPTYCSFDQMNCLTLFDTVFFEQSVIGDDDDDDDDNDDDAPQHNVVVIAPIIIKFGTGMKLDVFYTFLVTITSIT